MAHEAGTVNGTWCFPPWGRVDCHFLSIGVPSQIPWLSVEVEDQTSQGHPALPLPQRWARDGNRWLLPGHGLLRETDVSLGVFCLGSPCVPPTSMHGGF